MKSIYLRNENHQWQEYQYDTIEELHQLCITRHITIGEGVTIGERVTINEWATIGEGAIIGKKAMIGKWAVIGANATIGTGAVIGEEAIIIREAIIDISSAMFSLNLYQYPVSAYKDKDGNDVIQLGCHVRTCDEWESDFWNNNNEFPNDGSEHSEARLRAYKVACFFLNNLPK